jgi:hypothetical protein
MTVVSRWQLSQAAPYVALLLYVWLDQRDDDRLPAWRRWQLLGVQRPSARFLHRLADSLGHQRRVDSIYPSNGIAQPASHVAAKMRKAQRRVQIAESLEQASPPGEPKES